MMKLKMKKFQWQITWMFLKEYDKSIRCYENGDGWWDTSFLIVMLTTKQLRNFYYYY